MKVLLALALFACSLTYSRSWGNEKSSRIVYDEDNRIEIADVLSPEMKDISKAVAGRVHRWSYDYLSEENRGPISFYDPPKLSDPWGANVCLDEKFADQPSVVDCSGFLVGEDLLVTAGHCMIYPGQEVKNKITDQCSEYQWIFDYDQTTNLDLKKFDSKKLYSCKRVVYAKLDDEVDMAIIRLDRKVKDRPIMKIRTKGLVKKNQALYVIGHPSGLPKKLAAGAKVLSSSEKYYFSTNLDTFGGNSGSPVINLETHIVEGILVRGKEDYVLSELEGESCMRVNHCDKNGQNCTKDDNEIDGEHVTRIKFLSKFLK